MEGKGSRQCTALRRALREHTHSAGSGSRPLCRGHQAAELGAASLLLGLALRAYTQNAKTCPKPVPPGHGTPPAPDQRSTPAARGDGKLRLPNRLCSTGGGWALRKPLKGLVFLQGTGLNGKAASPWATPPEKVRFSFFTPQHGRKSLLRRRVGASSETGSPAPAPVGTQHPRDCLTRVSWS